MLKLPGHFPKLAPAVWQPTLPSLEHRQSSEDLQGENCFLGSTCPHQHPLPVRSTLHGTGAGAERGEPEQPFTALITSLNAAMRLTGIFLPFKGQLSLCSFVLAHVSLVEVEKIVAKQLFFCIFITFS